MPDPTPTDDSIIASQDATTLMTATPIASPAWLSRTATGASADR
jgi:hypothetical protein